MSSFDANYTRALAAASPKPKTYPGWGEPMTGWREIPVGGHFRLSTGPFIMEKTSSTRYKVVESDDTSRGLPGSINEICPAGSFDHDPQTREPVDLGGNVVKLIPVQWTPPTHTAPHPAAPAGEPGPGATSLRRDRLSGRSWLMFPGRPSADVIAKLKSAGWRWSGFRKEWHHPSRFATPPVPFVDEGLVDYNEERATRLTARAGKVGAEAQKQYEGAHRISSGIPMGQPILVGHHSERHHRRDLERIDAKLGRAFKGFEHAKSLEARAASSAALQEQKVSDPGMIGRRIKKNEADLRSAEKWLGRSDISAEHRAKLERHIAIHHEDIERDRTLLAQAGPLPEAAGDVAKRVKAALRKDYPAVKVSSSSGRAAFVEAHLPWQGSEMFSPALRNAALDATYGPDFARDRQNPNAGNIGSRRIVLRAEGWKVALGALGVRI